MVIRKRVLVILLCLAVGMSACKSNTYIPYSGSVAKNSMGQVGTLSPDQRYIIDEPLAPQNSQTTIGRFNARMIFMADQLERNAERGKLANTVIITSFTNLNKITETTAFGRLLSENLMHELQVRKWQVYEIRLSKDVTVSEKGEFSLSRDTKDLKETYKIGGIVTGTYSVVDGNIIVNARVMDMNTGMVVSSAQIHLPANWFTDMLLFNDDLLQPMKIMNSKPKEGNQQ